MQSQSKTDQLIYRISYRNHKKRLTQIKHNNTSLQFYNQGKGRPEDKKKIMMLKMKREEIQMENEILQDKIAKIHGRKKERESLKVKEVKNVKPKKRYPNEEDHEQDEKIQVKSDYGDGETKICIVPYHKNRPKIASYSSSQKRSVQLNLRSNKTPQNEPHNENIEEYQTESREKQTNSHPYLSEPKYKGPLFNKLSSIRESISKPDEETLYHEPQNESNRLVMFKKTRIPEPMLSYLIQISLIKKSILITAYAMGTYNHTLKLVLGPKRTQELLREVDDDYERIWQRVSIDSVNQTLRILDVIEEKPEHFTETIENKKESQPQIQRKYQIQQDFIRRNYYTLKDQKNEKQKQKSMNLKQKEKITEFKESAKKTGPSLRHTKIGEDWKKIVQNQNKNEGEVQKKEVKDSIKYKEKKKTENKTLKNESVKSKKIDNISNISSIKGQTNRNKEESVKESFVKSNNEYSYEQQYEEEEKIEESKQKQEQNYEEDYEKEGESQKQKEENYEMEYDEEIKEKKNQSNIKESMVYEDDFEQSKKKQKKQVDEEYPEEFDT